MPDFRKATRVQVLQMLAGRAAVLVAVSTAAGGAAAPAIGQARCGIRGETGRATLGWPARQC